MIIVNYAGTGQISFYLHVELNMKFYSGRKALKPHPRGMVECKRCALPFIETSPPTWNIVLIILKEIFFGELSICDEKDLKHFLTTGTFFQKLNSQANMHESLNGFFPL